MQTNPVTTRRFAVDICERSCEEIRFGQGCQMVYFQTKNPNLGKFWRALDRKILIYFMAICDIHLCSFGTFVPVLKNMATLVLAPFVANFSQVPKTNCNKSTIHST
jgi:hypothetical protein